METAAGPPSLRGETFASPLAGIRVVFGETGEETGGRRLRFDLFAEPGARVNVLPHRHPPAERFEVVTGRLSLWVAGVGKRVLGPGEALTVPPLRPHHVWNAGDEVVHCRVELRPGDRLERFFARSFGLTYAAAHPSLKEAARLNLEYRNYVGFLPVAPQRAALWAVARLAPAGRRLPVRAPLQPPAGEPPLAPQPAAADGENEAPAGDPSPLARASTWVDAAPADVFALLADPGAGARRANVGAFGLAQTATVLACRPPAELELEVSARRLLSSRVRLLVRTFAGRTHVTVLERPLGGALQAPLPVAAVWALAARNTLWLRTLRRRAERTRRSQVEPETAGGQPRARPGGAVPKAWSQNGALTP